MKLEIESEYPVSKAVYDKTYQQIEKWTRIVYFVFAKVFPPAFALPKCIASLYFYVTTDSDANDSDALELPMPMW